MREIITQLQPGREGGKQGSGEREVGGGEDGGQRGRGCRGGRRDGRDRRGGTGWAAGIWKGDPRQA